MAASAVGRWPAICPDKSRSWPAPAACSKPLPKLLPNSEPRCSVFPHHADHLQGGSPGRAMPLKRARAQKNSCREMCDACIWRGWDCNKASKGSCPCRAHVRKASTAWCRGRGSLSYAVRIDLRCPSLPTLASKVTKSRPEDTRAFSLSQGLRLLSKNVMRKGLRGVLPLMSLPLESDVNTPTLPALSPRRILTTCPTLTRLLYGGHCMAAS
mmetsp:Transcript_49405/g.128885  ORF Transcript_49405/g.128885 Transcript_49405/m.128885 type:complete len:212 (-) Transcript_49405:1096-1731(-)